MSDFDKRNTFTLNRNDRKTEDWHADWRGTLIDEDGNEFYLDAKLRQGKNGEFLSGKVKRKGEAAPAKQVSSHLDDNVPF